MLKIFKKPGGDVAVGYKRMVIHVFTDLLCTIFLLYYFKN